VSTFTLLVTYAAGHTDKIESLSDGQAVSAVLAFTRDLFHLEGKGATRVEIFVDGIVPTPRVDVFGNPILIEAST
jgi:hypothetical protein